MRSVGRASLNRRNACVGWLGEGGCVVVLDAVGAATLAHRARQLGTGTGFALSPRSWTPISSTSLNGWPSGSRVTGRNVRFSGAWGLVPHQVSKGLAEQGGGVWQCQL